MENSWEDFEEFESETVDGPTGPFLTDAVDPLIYSTDETSPELRAAAAYIPVAPKLTIREAAPTPPMPRKHQTWVPGGETATPIIPPKRRASVVTRFVRSVLALVMIAAPIGVIAALVWFGIQIYRQ